MGLRDRGLRLAGYLTPPSDLTQDDDENAERYFIFYLIMILGCDVKTVDLLMHIDCIQFIAAAWCRH